MILVMIETRTSRYRLERGVGKGSRLQGFVFFEAEFKSS